MTTVTLTSASTSPWPVPAGVTVVQVQMVGPGGNGKAGVGGTSSGGGGSGGAFAGEPALAVPASGTCAFTCPAGGSGTAASFTGSTVTVTANPGLTATSSTGAAAPSAGSNTQAHAGGKGGNGTGTGGSGGGGGSSAGTSAAGASGVNNGAGGTAPAGGGNGGSGGISGGAASSGVAGSVPGGGGGGGASSGTGGFAAGTGGAAQIILTYTAGGVPSLADAGAAADQIAAQVTGIPVVITAAVPRPAGPPPAPIPPQVLLVPSGAAMPQDTAAGADAIAVTAETIPLADVGAAADYSSSQIFQADQGAAADTIAVTAAVPLADTTGAATDLGGNVLAVQVNWAEAGAAADKSGTTGLGEMDAAGASDVLSVAATGITFTDTGGASDAWGQSAAVGGSGGASTPQAYPGTSQVAVAAPGSSVWSYLGSIGTITALSYGFKFPGGCDQLTCTVMVPASYRTQLFDDGWQVRVTRGGHTVWSGVLDEPVPPTSTSGWTLTAAGVGNLGTNFLATYTSTWPAGEPDQAVNNAISRGLPWTNPGIGTPSGLWLGQAVDSGAQNITALLNLACTRGGLAWTVNSQPGGQIGNDLSVAPLPSTPNRLLVCTTPVARTLAAAIRAIFVRYEITADSTTGSSPAPATYGLVEVQNSAAAPYSAGAVEQYLDLSDVGVMTATQAEQVAAYILEVYQQISFAGSFTARYGQLLNLGGVPVDPGTDQAGSVVRLVLLDFAFGGSVIPQPAEFIVGSYSWDDFAQVATIQAYNTLNQSLSSLLGLESTLLTPIQAASG